MVGLLDFCGRLFHIYQIYLPSEFSFLVEVVSLNLLNVMTQGDIEIKMLGMHCQGAFLTQKREII